MRVENSARVGGRVSGAPTLPGMERIPAVLSIAGSDSGGGAGIQADLKTFARCGVHGMTAITALTAQNTLGVTGVHPVPGDFIVEQVRAVQEDIGVDAVKIGMLGTAEIVAAVAQALDLLDAGTPVVVDPVMVAESGATLLDEGARAALVAQILPRATVVTPNVPEARVLVAASAPPAADAAPAPPAADAAPATIEAAQADALAQALHALGPANVVVTGGHRAEAIDTFFDGRALAHIAGERYADGAAHGSGCTHSSALAARLALGDTPLEAARHAKAIAAEAVRDGLRAIGRGPGPVNVLGLTAPGAAPPRGAASGVA